LTRASQAAQFAALPPAERKMQRRLIRNRLSAQLHRERQRSHVAHLETQVLELSVLAGACCCCCCCARAAPRARGARRRPLRAGAATAPVALSPPRFFRRAEASRAAAAAAAGAAAAALSGGAAGPEAHALARRVLAALPPALLCLAGVGMRSDGPGSLGYTSLDAVVSRAADRTRPLRARARAREPPSTPPRPARPAPSRRATPC
jgi:hypothetical protein